jgi:RluA family pseudouridine synthase
MPILEKTFHRDRYISIHQAEDIHHNLRLDQFCLLSFTSLSRELIKRKIFSGEIQIEGRSFKTKPSTRVQTNQKIKISFPRTSHEDEFWEGKKIKLVETPDILFEDQQILVISKPPFMATHPTGRHLFNCATVFLESERKIGLHSIHRLDRETSGLLILCKNPKISSILTPEFEKGLVQKCYFFIAKVKSPPKDKNLICQERLGNDQEGIERVYIKNFPETSSCGKAAKTEFSIIHQEKNYVLGLAFPKTGRQHQIRVHSKILGMPLLGDKLYLGSFELFQKFKDQKACKDDHQLLELPRQALHSMGLRLTYQGKKQIFSAPLPKDLKNWIKSKLSLDLKALESLLRLEMMNYFNAHQLIGKDTPKNIPE